MEGSGLRGAEVRAQRGAISVLMPVKNGENTIGSAIRSTMAALSPQDEFLVYDDGSTDHTVRVISSFKDPRIKVIRGGGGAGVAGGLNVLLSESRHSVIARMDADDMSFPWRFREQYEALERGTTAVFTTRINFGKTPRTWRQSWPAAIRPHESPLVFALENPVPHSSLLAQKAAVLNVGGYSAGSAEDYGLWLKLLARGYSIERLAKPSILYRMHPDQVTKSQSWRSRFVEDEDLASSHLELLRVLGWTGGQCWKAMHGGGPKSIADVGVLRELKRFLEPRINSLSFVWQLRQKVLLRSYASENA